MVKSKKKKKKIIKSCKSVAEAKISAKWPAKLVARVKRRRADFLKRRPHRSFRLTSRLDSQRSLKIEGYMTFSRRVLSQIKTHWRFFGKLLLVAIGVFATFSLLISQISYNTMREALDEATKGVVSSGLGGSLYRAALIFISTARNSGDAASDQSVALLTIFIALVIWLTVVYFLRHALSGKKLSFRQALYNSGSPLVPTLILLFIAVIQLTPLGIYLIVFSAAKNTEIINGGGVEMLAVVLGGLIVALTLYWLISTIIALVVVTLPDMKPIQALRVADDMVVGRRGRIVRRLAWQILHVVVLWVLVMIPVIVLEDTLARKWEWIKNVPIVPVMWLVTALVSLIWTSTYVYMLYRRILDDSSKPA